MNQVDTLLKVILDRASDEKALIENVERLQALSEKADVWTSILRDSTYSFAHRRVAFVQYFIRHGVNKKLSDLSLKFINVSPSDINVKVVHLWTGSLPIQTSANNSIVRIIYGLDRLDQASVYLSIFPKAKDSEIVDIIWGNKSDSYQVVTDVAAGEQLTTGAFIAWKKWEGCQVFEYLS